MAAIGHGGERPAAQRRPHHDGGVHAQHDEVAVREVDDVHHAPDQGEAGREQGIDRAEQQPAHDHLDQRDRHAARLPLDARGRLPALVGQDRPRSVARALGQIATYLPPRICVTRLDARTFWPLSSNFTPS